MYCSETIVPRHISYIIINHNSKQIVNEAVLDHRTFDYSVWKTIQILLSQMLPLKGKK